MNWIFFGYKWKKKAHPNLFMTIKIDCEMVEQTNRIENVGYLLIEYP